MWTEERVSIQIDAALARYPVGVTHTEPRLTVIARGAAAGTAATTLMSAVLEVGQRMTSSWRQPPTLIVRTALAGGPAHKLAGEDVLAIMAHLGYGTSCGALFALLSRRGLRPSPAVGVGYGLLLWLISYAAWVPAMRAIPLPQHDCPGRQSTLIGAHVVYGVVLATTLRRLRRRSWT